MSDDEIASLPVQTLAADTCALLLWATGPKLDVAVRTLKAWGFEYKGVFFVWVKTQKDGQPTFGMGSYTRSSAEFCLLGVRGPVIKLKQSCSVRQLIRAPRRQHSRKPVEAREQIERFFPAECPKIELFAREQAHGWQCWGMETDKFTDAPKRLQIEDS